MNDYEPRHCFIEEGHEPHNWSVDLKDQDLALPDVLNYTCDGSNVERDPWSVEKIVSTLEGTTENTPAPGVLDGRAAYGDRVQNMKEQAAMITAYLSGRSVVEAHDVPMILNLIKIHRLGKMPDYEDNYADIEGYTQIAREVIGEDMIEATTAKEYRAIKARQAQPPTQSQEEGALMDRFRQSLQNPYANIVETED
jgi:hypothetical protein